MDLQPTLKSELVILRPLEVKDIEPLYLVAKDPKIWEQHPSKRYLREEFEKFFEDSIQSKGALVILDQKTKTIIGSSRYKKIDGFVNGIEIGWSFLGSEYWGGTYNWEVKKLMMTYAFGFVENVVFYIDEANFRSQKAVEKIGGRRLVESENRKLLSTNANNVTYIIKKETHE